MNSLFQHETSLGWAAERIISRAALPSSPAFDPLFWWTAIEEIAAVFRDRTPCIRTKEGHVRRTGKCMAKVCVRLAGAITALHLPDGATLSLDTVIDALLALSRRTPYWFTIGALLCSFTIDSVPDTGSITLAEVWELFIYSLAAGGWIRAISFSGLACVIIALKWSVSWTSNWCATL